MACTRITVTLPEQIVADVDRFERNRSRFVLKAVRNEVTRRRQEALRKSLLDPHPESQEFADLGLADWADSLPDEDLDDLLDPGGGTAVKWVAGKGWETEGR